MNKIFNRYSLLSVAFIIGVTSEFVVLLLSTRIKSLQILIAVGFCAALLQLITCAPKLRQQKRGIFVSIVFVGGISSLLAFNLLWFAKLSDSRATANRMQEELKLRILQVALEQYISFYNVPPPSLFELFKFDPSELDNILACDDILRTDVKVQLSNGGPGPQFDSAFEKAYLLRYNDFTPRNWSVVVFSPNRAPAASIDASGNITRYK